MITVPNGATIRNPLVPTGTAQQNAATMRQIAANAWVSSSNSGIVAVHTNATGAISSITISNMVVNQTSLPSNATTNFPIWSTPSLTPPWPGDIIDMDTGYVQAAPNTTYAFKDGSTIEVNDKGEWTLHQSDKKKVYAGAKSYDFNRFINTSDILEDFIRYAAKLGIPPDDIFKLPINLFIMYLIAEAAKQDKEPFEEDERKLQEAARAFVSQPPAPVPQIAPPAQEIGVLGRFLLIVRVVKKMAFGSPDNVARIGAAL